MEPSPVLTIDVAHPPRPAARVEEELQEAVRRVRNTSGLRVLKVVHGYGSSGQGGASRETVLNWLYRHRRQFNAVIEGPAYSILDPATQTLRRNVGQYPDTDLDAANRGITVVWVR